MHVPHIDMYAPSMHACQAAFFNPGNEQPCAQADGSRADLRGFGPSETAHGLRWLAS
jgi:hypothetical protein